MAEGNGKKSGKNKRTLREIFARLKNSKKLIQLIIICTLLLVICASISIYHAKRIYRAFEETSYEYIFDRAQVTGRNFTEDFKRKGSLIESEAAVLSELELVSKENICSALKGLENSEEFKYARYIGIRGVKYSSDGAVRSTDINKYLNYVDSSDNYTVFKNFEPEYSNDEVCFSAAVVDNGIVQGYLIGVVNASSLFEAFDNNSATSVAERYLVDSNGEIIIYTKGNSVYDGTGKNIYRILTRDSIDDYAAEILTEEIINQLVADEMMYREVSIGGQKGYALFKQLTGNSGWAIFYIVYEENVKALIYPVITESVISMIAIMLIMMILAIFIMRFLSGEQKKCTYDN